MIMIKSKSFLFCFFASVWRVGALQSLGRFDARPLTVIRFFSVRDWGCDAWADA